MFQNKKFLYCMGRKKQTIFLGKPYWMIQKYANLCTFHLTGIFLVSFHHLFICVHIDRLKVLRIRFKPGFYQGSGSSLGFYQGSGSSLGVYQGSGLSLGFTRDPVQAWGLTRFQYDVSGSGLHISGIRIRIQHFEKYPNSGLFFTWIRFRVHLRDSLQNIFFLFKYYHKQRL